MHIQLWMESHNFLIVLYFKYLCGYRYYKVYEVGPLERYHEEIRLYIYRVYCKIPEIG